MTIPSLTPAGAIHVTLAVLCIGVGLMVLDMFMNRQHNTPSKSKPEPKATA